MMMDRVSRQQPITLAFIARLAQTATTGRRLQAGRCKLYGRARLRLKTDSAHEYTSALNHRMLIVIRYFETQCRRECSAWDLFKMRLSTKSNNDTGGVYLVAHWYCNFNLEFPFSVRNCFSEPNVNFNSVHASNFIYIFTLVSLSSVN